MKERILEYSKEIFMRLGFRSVTMDALAVGLGVSKKTIYQYFKDKDELIMEIVKLDIQEEEQFFLYIEKNINNPIEAIILISDFINQKLSKLNPICIHDMHKFHPGVWKEVMNNKNCHIFERVQGMVQSGIDNGLFKPEFDAKFVAIYLDRTIDLIFDGKSYPSGLLSFADAHRHTMNIFLYGIATEKGRDLIEIEKNKILKK